MKITEIEVEKLIPYANNPRNNDEAVDKVAASIHEFGFKVPVVVDGENVIVCGHTRVKAAKKLGIATVPCVVADDLTDAQIKAFRLADNKVSEFATWDFEKLELELADLPEMEMTAFGFDLQEKSEEETPEDFVEDEIPEEVEMISKPGDIWKLGENRLICGDSTDAGVIEKLMDGELANMVFTDPPYNVAIGSKNAVLNKLNHDKKGHRIEQDIEGDKGMSDAEIGEKLWKPAFKNMFDNARDDCSIYVTMPQGGTHMMMMMMMMADAGWQVKHELMWLKNQPTFSMGRLNYDYMHEPIMYGWKRTHNFYGKGQFNKSVWQIDKPRESKLHPTMKPVELIVNALLNSTKKNDVVLDVFGGSGSTLIACEQTGRRCYTCELDARYVDVIVKRWENFTGKKAELLTG